MSTKRAFALAAHPDDIEFVMAGTLILLKDAGYEAHYMNIANGSAGSMVHGPEEIARIRTGESRDAAARIGAVYHEPLVNDLEIFYEPRLLARLGAVLREVAPEILLLQSPQDYMEDHQNTVRLGVTAAFVRSAPNYTTDPPTSAVTQDVTIYHAQPHGNRDPLRQLVSPDFYIDIETAVERKKEMLACHASQRDWLDATQGMGSYVQTMVDIGGEVGSMSGRFRVAEGWRRHLHLGFCAEDADPLRDALSDFLHVA
jgi:LmbE family N-acetylglucosaminyl deacetylase